MGHEKSFYTVSRRIGSTTYRVKVYGSETATETMEDKILRLIRREAMDLPDSCGIMKEPQMSRQSKRSAS